MSASNSRFIDLNKQILFDRFKPYYDESSNELFLELRFSVNQKMQIRNKGSYLKTDSITIINLVCVLSLHSTKNIARKEIYMYPDPRYMQINLGSNISLLSKTDHYQIERLLKWRNGGDVHIGCRFYGHGLTTVNNKLLLVALTSGTSDLTNVCIGEDEWESIVDKSGLNNKYIVEYDTSIPENFRNKGNQFVNQVITDLEAMSFYLNNAKDRIRKARNISDYKSIMGDVKSSLDSIKDISIRSTTGRDFLVLSGTVSDLDPGTGDKAPNDIIGRIKSIIEQIYKISSKPAHTTLEKTKQRFTLMPDREDALFVLESSLCILKYLIDKSKKLN